MHAGGATVIVVDEAHVHLPPPPPPRRLFNILHHGVIIKAVELVSVGRHPGVFLLYSRRIYAEGLSGGL